MTSCANNSSNTNISNNNTQVETMEKHTIQLTLDNYQKYIEIGSTIEVYSTSTSTTFVFEDALDYHQLSLKFSIFKELILVI